MSYLNLFCSEIGISYSSSKKVCIVLTLLLFLVTERPIFLHDTDLFLNWNGSLRAFLKTENTSLMIK